MREERGELMVGSRCRNRRPRRLFRLGRGLRLVGEQMVSLGDGGVDRLLVWEQVGRVT